ncbi:hypothetical protein QUE06_00735 [Lactococcus lactis]|uniref:hypothetical protein n=1 Tax=Lactococcus lactis TaxID=1358 RepID=UPI0025A10D5A|nr:hypothetical protein [Lactococcus lactis]MDM7533488.1 hypothetical protein [Lactococcus lactis]
MKKKVIVVNMVAQKQNELITEFESAKQASIELGISYDSIRSACQDIGNCLIGDLAFNYESSVHGLSEGDVIIKIKQARLKKLIFGK